MSWGPWIHSSFSLGPIYPSRERIIRGHCGRRANQAAMVADLYAERFDTVTNEAPPDYTTDPRSRWSWRADSGGFMGERVAWIGEFDANYWVTRVLANVYEDDRWRRWRAKHATWPGWFLDTFRADDIGAGSRTVEYLGTGPGPEGDELLPVRVSMIPYDVGVESWLVGVNSFFPPLTMGTPLRFDQERWLLWLTEGPRPNSRKIYLIFQFVPPPTPPPRIFGCWSDGGGGLGPQMALEFNSPDRSDWIEDNSYVRLNQRTDGLGILAHPRLSASQTPQAPRVGGNNTYA